MKILNTQKAAIFATITMLWMGFPGLYHAQTVTTVAGGIVGDGGKATNAAFNYPVGVAEDQQGNYYVSELDGHRIRKINASNGKISTIAGTGIAGYNGDGILASAGELNSPAHIKFDPQGDLVVSDSGNCRVRKIDSWGIITTIAGNGTCGSPSGDGGLATSATLGPSYGIAYDNSGNLYISDFVHNVVRVVNTAGIIHPFAGNGTAGYVGDGGPATSAELNFPIGMVEDTAGNLYIAESGNSVVRKVDTSGTITTFAGLPHNGGFSGDGGPATSAAIGHPRGIAFHNGTIYFSNAGAARIRGVDISTNVIQTYAGSSFGYDGDGNFLTASQFARPSMIIFNSQGQLVVADTLNGRIREAGKTMFTIAGGYLGDGGAPTSAAFQLPEAVAFDSVGNYYIADSTDNRVRKITAKTGVINTVVGTGVSGYSGDGKPAINAQLSSPAGVAVDNSGNVFISDSSNSVIRKVNAAGKISTLASNPNFSGLGHIALDSANNLYVADNGACVVWKITPAGAVSVFAGVVNVCNYNGDNISATSAQLNVPYGVAFDSFGGLYIADSLNNRLRRVDTAGTITTVAGDGNCGYSGDAGLAASAELCFPQDMVMTSEGVYVADTGNLVIRKVSSGIITTYAGSGQTGYNGDALAALKTNLDDPIALAADRFGTVFELDDVQNLLRKIQ
jgi:sugar lactone lactonase YvrE